MAVAVRLLVAALVTMVMVEVKAVHVLCLSKGASLVDLSLSDSATEAQKSWLVSGFVAEAFGL